MSKQLLAVFAFFTTVSSDHAFDFFGGFRVVDAVGGWGVPVGFVEPMCVRGVGVR